MSKLGGLEGLRQQPFLRQATEHFRSRGVVRGLWDLDQERVSLGGLLLLRSELELLASACELASVSLSLFSSGAGRTQELPRLVGEVFKSAYSTTFEEYRADEQYWPDVRSGLRGDFSYQFFDRCTELYRLSGLRPSLTWDTATLRRAHDVRLSFKGRLYTAHLKQVPGCGDEQSNANLVNWREFLQRTASPGSQEFLLLGGEELPREFEGLPGVHVAQRTGLGLSAQLALIPLSDGFLGMASGVSAAAILSEVPYVVLKHPRHHVEEMRRQIGFGDSFSFASAWQRILRVHDSVSELVRSHELIQRGRS